MSSKKILAFIYMGSFFIFLMIGCTMAFASGPTPAQVEKILPQLVNKINGQLPMNVDKYTIWNNSMAFKDTIFYYYTTPEIDSRDPENADLAERIRKQNTPFICNSPDSARLLNWGVKARYVYRDGNGIQYGDFTVTEASCAAAGINTRNIVPANATPSRRVM